MTSRSYELSRKKLILFSAIPTLVALLLIAVFSEVGLRIRFRTIESITGIAGWKVKDDNYTYYGDIYHPVRGWTNKPGYRSDVSRSNKITINGQGLRAQRDYSLLPAAGVRRIAILGDSFTFGDEVNDDQALPSYLGRFLDSAEVLNFGVSGYGVDQMVLRLEEEVFSFNPTHVLLVIAIPSDLARALTSEYNHPKPAFSIKNGILTVSNSPVPTQLSQPAVFRHSFVAAWLFGRPKESGTDFSDDHVLAVSQALLARAKRACQQKGIPLIVLPILGPTYARQLNDADESSPVTEYHSKVKKMMETEGLTIANQYPFLREMIKGKSELELRSQVSSTIMHWAGRGNCLLAGNIARDLNSMDSLWQLSDSPPHCEPVLPSAAGSYKAP